MLRHADFDRLEADWGILLHGAQDYLNPAFGRNFQMAMDAQPSLVSTTSGGIPAFLTQLVDPNLIRVLLAPNKAAEILGEVRKGTWLDQTALFGVVERVGEVSNYGDFNNNGHAGANMIWPQRQATLYQTITEYGELELERAGLARLSWAAELDQAAVVVLNKYQTQTYFFGVQGLQNYGLLNDPNLPTPITPTVKAAGNGNVWVTPANAINSTAFETYTDIQNIFIQLVVQTQGYVERDTPLKLNMSPRVSVALTATNQYGINVYDLLKKNFPNITFHEAVQYSTAAGELVQLIAPNLEGQQTGYCAFNEKLRSHPVIRDLSSFKQKKTQGSWGAIIRQPIAYAQLLGV